MKTKIKYLLFFMLTFLIPTSLFAAKPTDFEVNGVRYLEHFSDGNYIVQSIITVPNDGIVIIPSELEWVDDEGATQKTPVTRVESGLLMNNATVTKVVLPEGIISIGNSFLKGCTNLKSVTIPSTVRTINSEALSNTGLEYLNMKDVQVTSLSRDRTSVV